MGYGGALIYSGLARNLKARWPQKKVVFVYPWTIDELLWRRASQDRQVWEHNDDIDVLVDRLRWFFVRHRYVKKNITVVNLDDPRTFYWVQDFGDRIEYKSGKHAIQIACDLYGLDNCELRTNIALTPAEEQEVDELLQKHSLQRGKYVCVEPHTKDTFTPNKAWFFDRWQELVNRLTEHFKNTGDTTQIVQIGAPDSPILKGVTSLVGQTTFRQTGGVLARSRLLVSAEGGLPHLAAAVNTPAVVLMNAVFPPELMAYPQNTNLYADQTCVCRGLKTPCPRNRACMAVIAVDDVYSATIARLGKTIAQPNQTLPQS